MEGDQNRKSDGGGNNDNVENRSRAPSQPMNIPGTSGARNRTTIPGSPLSAFPSLLTDSPPSFVSIEQIFKAAEDVSKSGFNMALAHEIAVNKDFKLHQNQPNSILKNISEICHKAFWDLLTEQLSSTPPDYTQALVLLGEIKEILLWLLLPHNSRLKNEINDVLDLALIEQQTRRGTIDFLSYAQFIITTMTRICAPVRDDTMQELRQLTEIVPLYRGILQTLDLMKLDMVNFTISHIRPHIQQQSVEYEKEKFKEILASLSGLSPPIDGLKFTRMWLQEVCEETLKELDTTDATNAVILRKAYIKILKWKETEKFPETLHLDHERFITLRDNLFVMVLTATVILVTYSNVGPSIQGISDFKETLKKHIQIILADSPQYSELKDLEIKMEAVGLQVVKEVNACLEQHGFSTLGKEKEESLIQLIGKIAEEHHSVRQLIMKRVLEFLELALHSSTNLKIPPGLSSLQQELSTFAGQFLSLIRHNQAVFSDYYNDIMNQSKMCQ